MSTLTTAHFDISIFEVVNGQINLTKICKHFGKRIDVWLKTKQTKAFLTSYCKVTPNGAIQIILGKDKEQGTFGTREVALKLAQWISPEFEVFCIQKLDELFQTGKTQLQPVKELTTLDILKLATGEIERLSTQLQETTRTLEHKQSIIIDIANTVPPKTMRNTINEVVKSYAKKTDIFYQIVWNRLYHEFLYTYNIDLKQRAKNSGKSKIEEAEKAGQLDNLYKLCIKMFECA